MKALDSYTALDLPHSQAFKDRVKQECDAWLHQTLRKECENLSLLTTDKQWRAHREVCLSLYNISLDQRVKKVHILLCAKKQKQNRTNFLA